mgnify:CR=1 FL=1|tara:strand:+ start:1350 stop:1631 length:282 start_codon:yes stop_codon:yes gene_type:complete
MKKKLSRKQIRSLVLKEVKQLLEQAASSTTLPHIQDILDILGGRPEHMQPYGYEVVATGQDQHIKVTGDEGNHMYDITVTESDEYKQRSKRVK